MTRLEHDRAFDPAHGSAVAIGEALRRITARNAGPFTWQGTNTYLVGRDEVAVIDPGPEDREHLALILEACGAAPVAAILVTHTHTDHSPGARLLQKMTGAPIVGCGPHVAARPLFAGEVNPFDASADLQHRPDRALSDGDTLVVDGLTLTAVETPGHTANHLAFALDEDRVLFSGDHVMAWSTSIVAPPDGSMSAYMASLDRLMARDDAFYLPGHGGPVRHPDDYLPGLKAHREGREQAVLARLAAGDQTIPEMVATIYPDVDASLHGAAGLSVLAHIEWLVERDLVVADGPPSLAARYRLAPTA
ncbi:MBL fold metallo-hydrolase [Stappia stellulata]|uniref:MBL fold metallo-hydrolase n=1 Tax=Stappia stellulata TaxID=71235 RepID=UPI0004050DEB|nr:MBL fold metallo-hydrolase [Stappia stellulata]